MTIKAEWQGKVNQWSVNDDFVLNSHNKLANLNLVELEWSKSRVEAGCFKQRVRVSETIRRTLESQVALVSQCENSITIFSEDLKVIELHQSIKDHGDILRAY